MVLTGDTCSQDHKHVCGLTGKQTDNMVKAVIAFVGSCPSWTYSCPLIVVSTGIYVTYDFTSSAGGHLIGTSLGPRWPLDPGLVFLILSFQKFQLWF